MTTERTHSLTQPERRPRPAAPEHERAAPGLLPDAGLGFALPPSLPTTGTLRRRAVQGLQATHGNHFVQRLLQRDGAAAEEQAPQPIDVSGLGFQEQLPGAGLSIQRRAAAGAIQRQSSPGAVVANVSMTVNQPSVQVKPGAQIGAAHGQATAVGWTTPAYNIQVPFGNSQRVDITITLDFVIELPSDYDPPRQQVVSDHEIGHVRIGERKAQQHLVTGLKSAIEANTGGLTPTNVQSAISAAATAFRTAEREGSQNYDSADYPRMVEAYRGTRESLRQLSAASPAIAAMASAIRRASTRIYSGIRSYDTSALEAAAGEIGIARAGLSNQELWRLQYNAEFQGRVSNLRAAINSYLNGSGLLGMPFETLPDEMRAALERMLTSLGGFTFSPSGASAAF